MISTDRIRYGLSLLKPEHGTMFEEFVNKFFATEFPNIRPVGQIHDKGRDAFIYHADGESDIFFQSSVTTSWKTKIKDTIEALKKNNFTIRELVYCTNQDLRKDLDDLKQTWRKSGISIDIRDTNYFSIYATTSIEKSAIAESLCKIVVDPKLADKGIIDSKIGVALSTEDQKIAVTFLEMNLKNSSDSRNLTKLSIESLITFTLRDSTPESTVERNKIHQKIMELCPNADRQRLISQIDGAIDRFVSKDVIKHHGKNDSFTLSFNKKKEVNDGLQKLMLEQYDLELAAKDVIEYVLKELEIDFSVPYDLLIEDAMVVLDYLIVKKGRLASLALVGKGTFGSSKEPLIEMVEGMVKSSPSVLKSQSILSIVQIIDILPEIVIELLRSSSPAVINRIKISADAYCLLFFMRESNDIQENINKIFSGSKVLVDTSVIVPCMAEQSFPKEKKRLSNLIRAASKMGITFFLGDDVLNELQTHLDRMRYSYYNHAERQLTTLGSSRTENLHYSIISGYLEAKRIENYEGSFEDFIKQFRGERNPNADLIEYLHEELDIRFDDNLNSEMEKIPYEDIGSLIEEWKSVKPQRPWMDTDAYNTLVYHDVKAFLVIQRFRSGIAMGAVQGEKYWWLTFDGSGFRMDRKFSGSNSICMSPEFFSRYVSLLPHQETGSSFATLLPIFLEAAKLGLVPAELRAKAEEIYSSMQGQKEYVIRRRLRDMVHQAMADRENQEKT